MPDKMTTANASGNGFQPLTGAVQLVYSQEILFAAMPNIKLASFATIKTELNTKPGQTIQFMKYNNLSGGGQLTEGVKMTTDNLSSSIINISVWEQGKAIKVSEYLLQTAFTDVMSDATKLLGRNYSLVLEKYLRDIVNTGTNVKYGATTAGSTGTTEATSRATTMGDFSTFVINNCVELLASNNTPKINGDAYICFAHPHQLRKLRDDSNWLSTKYYTPNVEDIYKGEVGRYNDVRFIETTLMKQGALTGDTDSYDSALDAAGSGSTDLYQALMFGENAFGLAYGLPVELRDNGIEDFGREHGLAWYAIYGSDIIENNSIVVIETA